MAVQNPFFGKREPEPFTSRTGAAALNPVAGFSNTTTTSATAAPAASSARSTSSTVTEQGGSKLTVGPNIKLKGVEITDCDTLVVEGTVEATMDSRVIHIAEQGAFHGSAEIDIAEIHGSFEGNLTVRQKLVVFSTGRVSGTIRYGKIVIEEGGQLSGDIQVGATKPATVVKAISSNTPSHTPASTSTLGAAGSAGAAAEASQVAV